MDWRWFGTITAGKNGDVSALVAQFAGKFLHDRRFSGPSDRQVANGDEVNAQGGVAKNPHIIKETANLDQDLEDVGASVGGPANRRRLGAWTVLKNDLQQESLDIFQPDTKALTHVLLMLPRRRRGGKK